VVEGGREWDQCNVLYLWSWLSAYGCPGETEEPETRQQARPANALSSGDEACVPNCLWALDKSSTLPRE
jgi:hypothetical protein